MAQVSWLVNGERSGRTIVTAPGASPADSDVAAAVERVDAALDGFPGPVPRWFRVLERIGRWWYVICVVIAVPVLLAVGPGDTILRLAAGVTVGLVLAPLTGGLLHAAARIQARDGEARTPQQSLAARAAVARQAHGSTKTQTDAILAADPAAEPRLHELAWDAANLDTPEGQSAARELAELWEQADPAAAAAQESQIARIKESLRALEEDGNA